MLTHILVHDVSLPVNDPRDDVPVCCIGDHAPPAQQPPVGKVAGAHNLAKDMD